VLERWRSGDSTLSHHQVIALVTALYVSVVLTIADMPKRLDLRCQIVRWVSDEFPGWVEASFTDATGKAWTLVDKSSIFTAEPVSADSTLPRPGVIRCVVVGKRSDSSGRRVIRVRAIDNPGNDDDVEVFDVEEAQLIEPASDIPEH
jgi:hypothetical protein